MRDLLVPLDESDLVQGPDVGGEPAVDAEDLAVDERGDGKHVEHLAAVAPHVAVAILVLALVIETVHLAVHLVNLVRQAIVRVQIGIQQILYNMEQY